MADVRFEQATRIYPGTVAPAVDALDLQIADGEFVVLVGPSGSGKTTALRMLAGLEEVDYGSVLIGGRDVTDMPPKKRDVAMVFQNYALYPYLTVAANMAFPLKIAHVKKSERERRVRDVAELLGLTEFLERKPGQLSGGQRQRVAMGRAIVREPSVFLMDEPLSNLDAKLRVQMRADIAALQARLGVTTVYVTHDQSEAMTLGHRVAVLGGREAAAVRRAAGALRPAGQHLRRRLHRLARDEPLRDPGRRERRRLLRRRRRSSFRAEAAGGGWPSVVVGLRPESLELAAEGVPATVQVVEEIGADAYVFCTAEVGGFETKLVARSDARRVPGPGRARAPPAPGRRGASVPPRVAGARQAERVTASESCNDSVKRGS